jgi:hypothetical protein
VVHDGVPGEVISHFDVEQRIMKSSFSLLNSCTAGLAFLLPFLFEHSAGVGAAVYLSYAQSITWLMMIAYKWTRTDHGRAYLLIGLPFVFFWPALASLAYVSCRVWLDCI